MAVAGFRLTNERRANQIADSRAWPRRTAGHGRAVARAMQRVLVEERRGTTEREQGQLVMDVGKPRRDSSADNEQKHQQEYRGGEKLGASPKL
jgi:hypothetical protein